MSSSPSPSPPNSGAVPIAAGKGAIRGTSTATCTHALPRTTNTVGEEKGCRYTGTLRAVPCAHPSKSARSLLHPEQDDILSPIPSDPKQGDFSEEPEDSQEEDVSARSDSADLRDAAPEEDFPSYTHMLARMAKSLKLGTKEPPKPKEDLVFGDIVQDKAAPLSLAFIPSLMDIVKESWSLPPNSTQITRRLETLYCTHGEDAEFLLNHPTPNSIVVQSNFSRSASCSKVTPSNREGRKLDVLSRKLYSFAAFLLRVANYQAAMGTYQNQLWTRILSILEGAHAKIKPMLINTYTEALTVAKHQRLVAKHAADVASKSMVSSVGLRRHAWLCSSGIMEEAKSHIEELPLDVKGLFNEKTDDKMENLHKIKKTAKSYTVQ